MRIIVFLFLVYQFASLGSSEEINIDEYGVYLVNDYTYTKFIRNRNKVFVMVGQEGCEHCAAPKGHLKDLRNRLTNNNMTHWEVAYFDISLSNTRFNVPTVPAFRIVIDQQIFDYRNMAPTLYAWLYVIFREDKYEMDGIYSMQELNEAKARESNIILHAKDPSEYTYIFEKVARYYNLNGMKTPFLLMDCMRCMKDLGMNYKSEGPFMFILSNWTYNNSKQEVKQIWGHELPTIDNQEFINKFIARYNHPFIAKFQEGMFEEELKLTSSIPVMFLMDPKDPFFDYTLPEFEAAILNMPKHKGDSYSEIYRYYHIDPNTDKQAMEYLFDNYQIRLEDHTPCILYLDTKVSHMYFKDEPITVEEIQEFFEELPTYMKSESVPAYQSENVYKIVSTTFNQVVHDPDKNVFVYIFNNKVSNKELKDIWIELAEYFNGDDSILIGQINLEFNDLADTDALPQFRLYPAKATEELPLIYTGEINLASLITFLDQNKSQEETNESIEKDEDKDEILDLGSEEDDDLLDL